MNWAAHTLFRRAAFAAQRGSMIGEIVLVRPVSLTFLVGAAACMALSVVLLFVFGGYTRRTTVTGVVMPDSGLVKVYARQPGVVVDRSVKEGQHVDRGQMLYTVSTDLQSEAEGATQAALIAYAQQRKASLLSELGKTRDLQQVERDTLRAKIANLSGELARIDDQLAIQRTRTSIAADATKRYRSLLEQDYISKDQAQQREADLLDQQSKLNGLLRERVSTAQSLTEANNTLAGLGLKEQNQLAQIDRNVIDVDQNLIESEAKRRIVVTAPEAGTVTAAIADIGQSVDTSRPLASVVPRGAHWQAHLFVPSGAIGFVRVGESVLIRYQAFPYQKFGQYRAVVTSIAHTALSAEELANEGGAPEAASAGKDATFYRVTVALDAQDVVAYGKKQPLQAGMSLQADILQEHRRLYEWVLEPLYSLTGKI
ncbi:MULTISPECIES: HlyD family secretion protein [unclassified Burkholderia]|uniref:HlyD family secretion protein n=1 Tax=unclassified Burkholderia TaxID=2613784 RepID=UPI0015C5B3C3|nr:MULTISPECIES: HlyD family efflux transporter periplasmic adaptor subunit [unclassified Burkholderia]